MTSRTLFRPIAFVSLAVLFGFLFSTAAIILLDKITRETGSAESVFGIDHGVFSSAFPILESSSIIASFAMGLMIAGAIFYKFMLASVFTQALRFRWKIFFCGFVLIAVFQGTSVALTVGLGAPTSPSVTFIDWGLATLFCLLVLVFYIPGVIGEEIIFRGWLLYKIHAPVRFMVTYIVISAAIFSMAHIEWNAFSIFVRFISGLAYAWSFIRLGGIEFAFGGHLAKNSMIVWMLGPPGEHRWTGTDYELNAVATILSALAFVGVVELIARRSVKDENSR